jgi:hypothetical protein
MVTEAVELLSSHVRSVFPKLTGDAVAAVMSNWEAVPYFQGDSLAGIALMRGTEIHWFALPHFRLKRKKLREFLSPLFRRHGMLTTRLAHADASNQRFNKVFGFKKTWSDSRYHYFMMTELPFGEREKACQL